MNNCIYLASASPRRRELLAQLEIPVELVAAEIDETPYPGESALGYTERLARAKAEAGWAVVLRNGQPSRLLLAADTTVALDGEIFGKPANGKDAHRMLSALSGRRHQVITGVAVCNNGETVVCCSETEVVFRTLTEADITHYLESGEPFDKAGAYGIQGKAAIFVERISGSFSGVVGLPLFETAQLLEHCGYHLSWKP